MLLCLPVVCCYVHPGLGLNCMQDLRVEEMRNGLDKPSAERNLMKKIKVDGESSMHTLKSTRRDGIAQGTVDQRRGCFLAFGV